MLSAKSIVSVAALIFSVHFLGASNVAAQTVTDTKCKNTVQLADFRGGGILYKPENEHGSRGATFLVQHYKYWFGPKPKKIYDSKCQKVIGKFALWARGYAYGERYYSKMVGGSGDTGTSLYRKAKKATRSSGGIVVVNKDFSVRIKDFRVREGFVRAP